MRHRIAIELPEIYKAYRQDLKDTCRLSLPLIDKLIYMEGMKHAGEIDLIRRLTKEQESSESAED
jgi:hypothetical protein